MSLVSDSKAADDASQIVPLGRTAGTLGQSSSHLAEKTAGPFSWNPEREREREPKRGEERRGCSASSI